MSNHKTPSIRFKGFTDDWEQRKLEDFGKATGGTSIESEFSEDGIYKVISIGSYSENSVYNDQGIRAIKSDKTSNRILNRNDLTMILNDKTTSGNIIGRVLLIEESGIYIYNQRTERIEINLDEYDPVFLYEMLNAPNIREKIIKQAQGNTQIYVNWTAISLLEYMIPSKEEQVKIGEYLHSISNLITLHQRKYEKLVNVKKSMLDKMFPKNDFKVPEIRFKGFTDDWEQRKVSDLLELLTDYDANGSFADMARNVNTTDGTGYAWYVRMTDLENPKPLSELKYVDETSYKFLKKTELHGGELLMAKRGNIGKAYIFEPRTPYATVAPNMYLLKLNDKVIPHFLYNYFISSKGNNQLVSLNASSTMGALYKDDVKNINVIMPSIEEQQKIGEYFSHLDNLITLHQRELEKLQNLKKSLLNSMFI